MSLQEVVANSNYITDEDLISTNLLGIANTAIAEINTRCGTKLPFFKEDDVTKSTYTALSDSWLLALLEAYLSYSIMANDGDTEARDFHYNRFLTALANFKKYGLGSLSNTHLGSSLGFRELDVSDVTVHWGGWI